MNLNFLEAANSNQLINTEFIRAKNPYLIVCLGMGRDSIAVLVLLKKLGICPEKILFSDLGSEKEQTYQYLPIINQWLNKVGFPQVTVIKAERTRDSSFEHHLFRLGVFPALTYGSHACAVAWKIQVIDKYLKNDPAFQDVRRQNREIVKAVGYEAGEEYRAERKQKKDGCAEANAFKLPDGESAWYPLIEHGITLEKCIELIKIEIGYVPCKSSCYMCPAMRRNEIESLHDVEPNKFFKGLVLERLVQINEVVPSKGRNGLMFGKKWSDLPYAKQYEKAVEKAIEIFSLKRTLDDGLRFSDKWKPKTERVKIFIDFTNNATEFNNFLRTLTVPTAISDKLDQHPQIKEK